MARFVDPVRYTLDQALDRRGLSMIAASRMLGRNDAWLQQFMQRGTPRKLPEDDRRLLAMALDLDECELGARMPYRPAVR